MPQIIIIFLYDFEVARIANDLCEVFLCIIATCMRLCGSALAGNPFHSILTISEYLLLDNNLNNPHTLTHARTHTLIYSICWYFPLPLLALSFSHPKMHLHFSLPTNLYAVCLEFVFIQQCLNHFKNRVYFDDDREKSENSSVRATKQERWNFIVHSLFHC